MIIPIEEGEVPIHYNEEHLIRRSTPDFSSAKKEEHEKYNSVIASLKTCSDHCVQVGKSVFDKVHTLSPKIDVRSPPHSPSACLSSPTSPTFSLLSSTSSSSSSSLVSLSSDINEENEEPLLSEIPVEAPPKASSFQDFESNRRQNNIEGVMDHEKHVNYQCDSSKTASLAMEEKASASDRFEAAQEMYRKTSTGQKEAEDCRGGNAAVPYEALPYSPLPPTTVSKRDPKETVCLEDMRSYLQALFKSGSPTVDMNQLRQSSTATGIQRRGSCRGGSDTTIPGVDLSHLSLQVTAL